MEDARTWAAKKRESIELGNREILYDIVVHDCFSGGGVPEHIFTVEFWKDLKSVIQPDGIVVVVSGFLEPHLARAEGFEQKELRRNSKL